MDISLINPQNNSQTGSMFGANPKVAAAAVAKKSDVEDKPVAVAAVEKPDIKLSDEKRFETIKRAAQHFFKDVYVVSDTTFSIFKDGTGQYVTRFTNLRDGSVTYIPEPDILMYMESRGAAREAFIEIDA